MCKSQCVCACIWYRNPNHGPISMEFGTVEDHDPGMISVYVWKKGGVDIGLAVAPQSDAKPIFIAVFTS